MGGLQTHWPFETMNVESVFIVLQTNGFLRSANIVSYR